MSRKSDDRAALIAAICAGTMIANQVAGKATRDAIFLANFAITDLPTMLIVASVMSVLSVLVTARLMARFGPARLVPAAFAISAAFFVGEWFLIRHEARAAAVALYLQMAIFGVTLISGFWSLINERFDPHAAKKRIGRIAGGGTLGGLIGGIIAERVAAHLTMDSILPVLAALHLGCGALLWHLREPRSETPTSKSQEPSPSGFTVLRQTSYLRDLAALVLFGTIASAMIDYVFKATADAQFSSGESLMRFFAVFYTITGLVTFVVQAAASRIALERLGLGATIATLPGVVCIGAGASLLFPGLGVIAGARGADGAMRSSLFRSAYELMYTPLSPAEKRTTKTIIDVGFDRAGDAVGGGLIQIIIFLVPLAAREVLLFIAIGLASVCLLIAFRLRRGYIKALEKSLLSRAKELNISEIADGTTRSTILQTLGTLDIREILGESGMDVAIAKSRDQSTVTPPTRPLDPLLRRIADLRSGDLLRVRTAIVEAPIEPSLVAYLVPLLAWQEVSQTVIDALRPIATRHVGQLLDSLLDPDQEFAVRRRIPRALASAVDQRAVDGLVRGLRDKRFEVRFQCGQALQRLTGKHPELVVDRSEILAAVSQGVKVDKRVWESRRLLDSLDGSESDFVDDFLRKRSSNSLEHVFGMLALVLPRQPLRVAYRGLYTDDKLLLGTALEYLESVLPKEIRDALWPFLDADVLPTAQGKQREEILESLMRSNESIEINLNALREKLDQTLE